MSDAEAALAAHLNGNFFWEHTANPEEAKTCKTINEIRRAQKKFSKDARHVTTRNKNIPAVEDWKPGKYVLKSDQAIFEPIVLAIAEAYKISVNDLMGSSTTPKFQQPKRHLYWAVMKYIPKMTYSDAGNVLGRCHSTVMHGCQMFQSRQDFEKVVEVERLLGVP